MEFIDQSSELNDTRHYPQLMERCATIGYEVSKVVFRGYFASPVLQSMHDNTIMSRNQLKMAVSNKIHSKPQKQRYYLFVFKE